MPWDSCNSSVLCLQQGGNQAKFLDAVGPNLPLQDGFHQIASQFQDSFAPVQGHGRGGIL